MDISTKKVLHIYTSWTKGGAEKRMIDLAKSLKAKGVESIIGAPRDSYIFKQAELNGLDAYHLMIRGSFAPVGIWQLYNIVKKQDVDIIHAHQGKVFWPSILIKWFLRSRDVKVVFHRRAENPHRPYSRSHYRFADMTIAISNAVAGGLINRENVPPNKVQVIYNGLDTNVFSTEVSGHEVRKKYNLGTCPVIGLAASMNKPKGKGHQYLIGAAKILNNKFPDARYLIVGTGPLEQYYKDMAEKQGLADKVIFTGYREDVENYIAAMDIFCLLSWESEGFGQVMIEAQAMGKVVVGTNVGGVPETFRDGETGILIPKEDTQSLANALDKLLSSKEERKEMSTRAVEFVKSNFDNDKMIEKMIKLYKELYA